MIMCKEISAKSFFASIPNVDLVKDFFKTSLEMGHLSLSMAAMEELIFRGYKNEAEEELEKASKNGCLIAHRLINEAPSMERTVFENIILSIKSANS